MAVKSLSIRIDEEMLNKLHVLADYEGRSANSEILILIRDAIEEFEKAHGKIALWCCLELIYNISIVNKTFIPDNPSVSFHSTAPFTQGSRWFVQKCLPGVWVRVSGGHLCEAEAPTEVAAETVAAVWLTEGLLQA